MTREGLFVKADPGFYLAETYVSAIIECARQICRKYIEEENDDRWDAIGIEDQLIDLVANFQQLRDGYPNHNALEDKDTWERFLKYLRTIDPNNP